jgi:predicted transcriptional regulator
MYILEKKKLLRCRKIGLVNFYTPIRTRDEVVRAEMSSLLARVFDGSVTDLANSLLSLENVSLDEIQNIKKLLHQKEKELQKIKS